MDPAGKPSDAVELDGARVLLTGASAGIGAATAVALAEHGATVLAVARRADRLAEVVEKCRSHTPDSDLRVLDLADPDAAAELGEQAWKDMGGIDVVINNAAAPKRRPVTELTAAEIRATMNLNFHSPVRLSLAVLPYLLNANRGLIVNVSSFAGRVGVKGEAAYCASKFALCGWSESMALDLWHTEVGVRLILPGAIATEIWDQPDNDAPLYDGELEPAATVADGIVDAIQGEGFEHYLPDMQAITEYKTASIDDFFVGAMAFADERS